MGMLVKAAKLKIFVKAILLKTGAREDVAELVSEGLVRTSVRGVDSHGVRLLPHYVEGLKKGRINPNPKYKFTGTSPSTGTFDADHTFGHAAGIEAARKAVELAKAAGTGHIAVYNSSHFGAAAYYGLEIAEHDMIGMSFTNTDALIQTYGGKKPFFGNNPICVAVPCEGEGPFCLDMATSLITFNKLKRLRERCVEAPEGAGADKDGNRTINPNDITMLSPIGGYKGYGLSMVAEVLCGLLTGMPYGPHIPKMFEAPMSEHRFLGHFISAIRIDCFQDKEAFKKRMAGMMREIRNTPVKETGDVIRVAGDPEKSFSEKRLAEGIPLETLEYERLSELGNEYGCEFD